MTPFIARACGCLAAFALACALPAAAADTATMKIVYADYRPYSWSENGRAAGLEVDLLEEALHKRLGIPLEHTVLPWARAQQYVRDGLADAFVATPSAERATYAQVSHQAVTWWELSLFYRKGDERFSGVKSVSDLKPFLIGSMIGNGWVKENLGLMEVHYVEKMELLPRMLTAGRIDVVPDNPYVMHHALRADREFGKIAELPLESYRRGMFLHVGRQSPFAARLGKIDEVLKKMQADGTSQAIHARYKGAE